MSYTVEVPKLHLNTSTNQVLIGGNSGITTTLSVSAPSASRIITIPDAGADSSILTSRNPAPTAAGASRAIAASESGTTLTMSAAAARIFTLPAVATSAGVRYKFVVTTVGANTITIRAASACQIGQVIYSAGAPTASTSLNLTSSTDLVFAVNQLVGSWAEYECDGVSWFVKGMSTIASGFTVA